MTLVLVTGGCGFIGSNFVRYLLETDPDVTVLNFDCLTYAGNLANLADLAGHPRYEFVKGDITDREQVRAAMRRGVTDVINFAAESHVDRSIQDSGPFVRTNVIGTQILLDAAREFGVKKFVQVSTDEVYGSLGPTGRRCLLVTLVSSPSRDPVPPARITPRMVMVALVVTPACRTASRSSSGSPCS